jgi:integrase
MRVPSSQTIVVRPEQIRLTRRENSKKWQVHYKIDGIKTWFRKSVQTTDVDKAVQLAERLWMKATFEHEEGRPVISKKFKPVAEVVLRRLEEEIKAGTAKPIAKDYVSAINLYLIPYYGNFNVDNIKPATVSQFHVWRKEKVGRELSGSAQNNHNAAFNLVMDEAVQRGYLSDYHRPSTKNTGAESDRRAEFSHEELETLLKYSTKFIAEGRTDRTKMIRQVLAQAYVPFLAATGIRAGTESENLEWRHIDVEVVNGQPVLHIRLQQGKLGPRNFVAHNSCWRILEVMRQISPDLKDTPLEDVLKQRVAQKVFRLSDGTVPDNWNKPFRQMLEDSNLLKSPVTDKERSLYSLRHYYATQRLLEGIPIHDLAQQMGTSVLMIQKHYSHLTPLMKATQFAGSLSSDGSAESAEIKAIMSAQMVNNNILSLVQLGTTMTTPLVVQSQPLTNDFENRLKVKLKQST